MIRLTNTCISLSTLSTHSPTEGEKGHNATPVHFVPEEFIHYLFKALICCPWGDVELDVRSLNARVPQFKLIARLLRACFTAAMGSLPGHPRLRLWPVAPFNAGLSARCQDGLPLMALGGFHI